MYYENLSLYDEKAQVALLVEAQYKCVHPVRVMWVRWDWLGFHSRVFQECPTPGACGLSGVH